MEQLKVGDRVRVVIDPETDKKILFGIVGNIVFISPNRSHAIIEFTDILERHCIRNYPLSALRKLRGE